ncbi:MAG: YegP family protein [Clostridia bacterium]|nr:YegP family protein [Clostridia bacterium]
MAKGRYEITKNSLGEYSFTLFTLSGVPLARSGKYKSLPPLKKGIASLRVNADAPLEDLTDGFRDTSVIIKCPKIELIGEDIGGMVSYNFVLKAKNGSIIAKGEGYGTKKRCLEAISNLRYIAFSAETDF